MEAVQVPDQVRDVEEPTCEVFQKLVFHPEVSRNDFCVREKSRYHMWREAFSQMWPGVSTEDDCLNPDILVKQPEHPTDGHAALPPTGAQHGSCCPLYLTQVCHPRCLTWTLPSTMSNVGPTALCAQHAFCHPQLPTQALMPTAPNMGSAAHGTQHEPCTQCQDGGRGHKAAGIRPKNCPFIFLKSYL